MPPAQPIEKEGPSSPASGRLRHPLNADEIRDVNTRYHDVAASHYDHKWGIDFGGLGHEQVTAKVGKALGCAPGHYARSLEIGAGTGYFTLNMLRAGLIGEATCSDISPGMLRTLRANAERLGLEVKTKPADAERLPFADGSFDLVFGHAVLHHIPDLQRAFGEFARVLAPGGTILFAGEPSRYGDRLAGVPKRFATTVAPLWRRVIGAGRAPITEGGPPDAALEGVVDVHAFSPGELRSAAQGAGLDDVRVIGEELLANWFGWVNRTLEATAEPDDVPWAWRQYAYRGYLLLQELDRRLLESRLPAAIFYNLMIAAQKPAI
ncbi:MAG TPA: class I SAM-dependent methyltransferase [Solirubrobacteraceae bacterium]|nr:class I SAM-dependent methyltransferase [Solirubrobacteraceae bacterium]